MSGRARTIICGTDGSPGAAAALDWAAAEAARTRAPLVVLAVSEPDWIALRPGVAAVPPPAAADAPAYLDEAVAHVAATWPGVAVSARQVAGHPAPALIAAGDEARMVVVGARGRSHLAEVLLGSVSRHVSAHALCPVAVVRETPDDPSRPVAVGIDGSQTSLGALRTAMEEAELRGTSLLVVHAWRDRSYTGFGVHLAPLDVSGELEARAEELTARELALVADDHPGVKTLTRVVRDHPVTALVQASREAQLVVVGAHGRGHFAGMRQGAVTAAVVHDAQCPVLVVPPPHG